MGLSLLRHEHVYLAIKEEHEENGYPISALCHLGKVSRAAYYKWLHRGTPAYEAENNRIAEEIENELSSCTPKEREAILQLVQLMKKSLVSLKESCEE